MPKNPFKKKQTQSQVDPATLCEAEVRAALEKYNCVLDPRITINSVGVMQAAVTILYNPPTPPTNS